MRGDLVLAPLKYPNLLAIPPKMPILEQSKSSSINEEHNLIPWNNRMCQQQRGRNHSCHARCEYQRERKWRGGINCRFDHASSIIVNSHSYPYYNCQSNPHSNAHCAMHSNPHVQSQEKTSSSHSSFRGTNTSTMRGSHNTVWPPCKRHPNSLKPCAFPHNEAVLALVSTCNNGITEISNELRLFQPQQNLNIVPVYSFRHLPVFKSPEGFVTDSRLLEIMSQIRILSLQLDYHMGEIEAIYRTESTVRSDISNLSEAMMVLIVQMEEVMHFMSDAEHSGRTWKLFRKPTKARDGMFRRILQKERIVAKELQCICRPQRRLR